MKAVRFDEYGPVAVLDVRDVPIPEAGPGQVLIRVKAAGINPGEAKIREGVLHERWPATFPSGQGSDFAGVVERLGAGVTAVAERDEVIGWVDTRSSQAEYVVADAGRPRAAAVRPALGGGGRDPGGRLHRLGDGPRGRRQAGRHRRRLRRGRRRRLARGPARPARGRDRDRPGGPVQPRLAQAARRDPGRLRRRRRRPDQGRRPGPESTRSSTPTAATTWRSR